jgi:hypothetical protein
MTAKKKKKLIKVRQKWGIHPATRVEKVRAKYNRRRAKLELKKILEQ